MDGFDVFEAYGRARAYVPDPRLVRERALFFTRQCHHDLDADELIERSGIVAAWFAESMSLTDFDLREKALWRAKGERELDVADLLAEAMKLYDHMVGAESWDLQISDEG